MSTNYVRRPKDETCSTCRNELNLMFMPPDFDMLSGTCTFTIGGVTETFVIPDSVPTKPFLASDLLQDLSRKRQNDEEEEPPYDFRRGDEKDILCKILCGKPTSTPYSRSSSSATSNAHSSATNATGRGDPCASIGCNCTKIEDKNSQQYF